MEKITAVVFDLDGTLVDSLADIASAVNSTLAAHGRRPHSLEAYNAMVGWGLKRLLVTASADDPFMPAELDGVYDELLGLYRLNPVKQTHAYTGIAELLAKLSGHVKLGVLSNKEDGMTKIIVKTLFPDVSFDLVLGSRPGKPNKPDPSSLFEMLQQWRVEPSMCAFLGDSDVDMETALGAHTWACGAEWGFRTAQELRHAGAHEVFSTPLAFGSWLESRTGTVSLHRS